MVTIDGLVNIKDIGEKWSIFFPDDEDEINAKRVLDLFKLKC